MHALFLGSVHEVAERLIGKILRVEGHTAIITQIHLQTAEDNAKWVRSKPLFGDDPVDVYVSRYRGATLLFLRTSEVNTCVRIDGIEMSGDKLTRPTAVCQALGIDQSRTGNITTDGTVITITWQN